MPVLLNAEDKPVAFRCESHRDVPVLNLSAKFQGNHNTECAVCCMDQAADALLAQLGELVDKAAARLEFFEPGTGEQLKRQAAEFIQGISNTTPSKET